MQFRKGLLLGAISFKSGTVLYVQHERLTLDIPSSEGSQLRISVELFGTARALCKRRFVDIDIGSHAGQHEIAAAIARECPALVGPVVRDDLSSMRESFVLNLNGLEFVQEHVTLRPGDRLLLFSSQAGG